MSERGDVRVALVGYGAWGSNLARAVRDTRGATLAAIADRDPGRLAAARVGHREARLAVSLAQALEDPSIEAVAVATPATAHAAVAAEAIAAGRDVFVEKPLTHEPGSALALCRAAREAERVLMVGHLLRYHPAVRRLDEGARRGELGKLLYLRTERSNPGRARADVGVLHALLPHDVSVALRLFGDAVESVRASAADFRGAGRADHAELSIRFRGGALATCFGSWLEAAKVRRMTLVGDRATATFDDTEAREKLRVVGGPRPSDPEPAYGSWAEWIGLRFGEVRAPEVSGEEPLRLEMEHFVARVRDRARPETPGEEGLAVVRVLDAAERSIALRGAPVEVPPLFES